MGVPRPSVKGLFQNSFERNQPQHASLDSFTLRGRLGHSRKGSS